MIPTIKEYIYIRRHENYDKYNVCKLGQTTNIPNRNSHYNTSEYIPGKFIAVYRITTNTSSKIETLLQRRFEEFHRLGGGGIEYYDIQIIDLIETHLNELCEYEKLSEDDINDLIRTPREKDILIARDKAIDKAVKIAKQAAAYAQTEGFSFYLHQQQIIDSFDNTSGIVCLATGLGKTITGFGIINKFFKTNNGIVLWHCYQKDILLSVKNNYDNKYKYFNILDSDIKIIWSFEESIKKSFIEDTKILKYDKVILIINTSKVKNLKTVVVNKIKMSILDECHALTADTTYDFEYKKLMNCINIGLSATPIKLESMKSKKHILNLYNKKYIGTPIDLINAINDGLLIPFTYEWISYPNLDKIKTSNIMNDEYIIKHLKILIPEIKRYIQSSVTQKLVIWTKTIKWAKHLKEELEKDTKDIKIFSSNSKTDPTSAIIGKFISNIKTGIIICVNRFRQGTDDPSLDTGISIEFIKKRMAHRSIQMIGRLLRKNKNKKKAVFAELYEQKTEDTKCEAIIKDIFNYYDELNFDNSTVIMYEDDSIKIKSKKNNREIITFKVKILLEDTTRVKHMFKRTFEELMKAKYKQSDISWDLDDLISHLQTKKIMNKLQYHSYVFLNKTLELPEQPCYAYDDFSWSKVVNNSTYYTKDECITKLRSFEEIHSNIYDLEDHDEINEYLHKLDNKIPNKTLWKWYGGERGNYVFFT